MRDHSDTYFLIVYDRPSGTLVHDVVLFTESGAALDAYAQTEDLHWGKDGIEVLLVIADSLETVRITHAHYFFTAEESAAALALVGL